MSLLSNIKAAQLQARKNRDAIATNVLTTLVGEAEAVGKNAGNRESTDAEVVAVVKKFIKNMDETLALINQPQAVADLQYERSIVSQYLPQQLTSDQLKGILESLTNELNAHTLREMGKIMKVLKERFDGQYDGALASTLIKGMLQ